MIDRSHSGQLLTFETVVHAAPSSAGEYAGSWQAFDTLDIDPTSLTQPFEVTFEQVGERLSRVERMFFEPDGYFVWSGDTAEGRRWQVDGVVYDRNDRLFYVEMRGTCPAAEFAQLIGAFGSPPGDLIFQIPQAAVYLDMANFLQYAARLSANDTLR